MLIDVHAHMSSSKFDSDRDAILTECKKRSIMVVTSTTDPDELDGVLALAKKHDNVHVTVGLNPSKATRKGYSKTVNLIKKHKAGIIGVGEVGLDYHWVKEPEHRAFQRKIFADFITFARQEDLSLIVHCRDAEDDMLEILERQDAVALLHCFSGSLAQAEKAVKIGCLISIPTSVVHSKSKQRLATQLPIASLVIETDSPYLSPEKGVRNTPLNLSQSVNVISGLKGINPSVVQDVTSKNALQFFNINAHVF